MFTTVISMFNLGCYTKEKKITIYYRSDGSVAQWFRVGDLNADDLGSYLLLGHFELVLGDPRG